MNCWFSGTHQPGSEISGKFSHFLKEIFRIFVEFPSTTMSQKSWIWNHFEKKNEGQVKCLHCPKMLVYKGGNGHNLSSQRGA